VGLSESLISHVGNSGGLVGSSESLIGPHGTHLGGWNLIIEPFLDPDRAGPALG